MKRKNDEQSFGDFIGQWIAVHIGSLILMGALYFVLLIPLLPHLSKFMTGRPLPFPWDTYSDVIPSIMLVVPFLALGWMQARTSFNSLHVLPKRWAVFSAAGVLLVAALYAVIFQMELLTFDRLGMGVYRLPQMFIGLLLIGMGAAQALLLIRHYSPLTPLGWLLIHVVTAGILVALLDTRQGWIFFLLHTVTTGALCWYCYHQPESEDLGAKIKMSASQESQT